MLPPLFVSSLSKYCKVQEMGYAGVIANPASGAELNMIMYLPVTIAWPYPVKRWFHWTGSSPANNVDIGLMTRDGVRVFSTGATAQGTASVPQYISGPILIPPGEFYLALCISNGTSFRITASNSGNALRQGGILGESGTSIPAVMTPAAFTTAIIPIFGFTMTESGY